MVENGGHSMLLRPPQSQTCLPQLLIISVGMAVVRSKYHLEHAHEDSQRHLIELAPNNGRASHLVVRKNRQITSNEHALRNCVWSLDSTLWTFSARRRLELSRLFRESG